MYEMFRDNQKVFEGTQYDCMKYIHTKHSFSFHWACEFEGYSIKEKENDLSGVQQDSSSQTV